MHQGKDEKSPTPVFSLSIGGTCVFRVGNTRTRTRPCIDIELASGGLFA
jgi:DNA oxidative demethylase